MTCWEVFTGGRVPSNIRYQFPKKTELLMKATKLENSSSQNVGLIMTYNYTDCVSYSLLYVRIMMYLHIISTLPRVLCTIIIIVIILHRAFIYPTER